MESPTNPEDSDTTLRRPMNAFLLFCKRHRSIVKSGHPWLDNRSCTKMLADMWAVLDWEEKSKYLQLAKDCKLAFMKAHPDYKWCGSNKQNSKGTSLTMRTRTKSPSKPAQKTTRVWSPDCWSQHKEEPSGISSGKLADPCDMGGLSLLLLAGEQSMRRPSNASPSGSQTPLSPKSRLFEFAEMCSDQLDLERNSERLDTDDGPSGLCKTDYNANSAWFDMSSLKQETVSNQEICAEETPKLTPAASDSHSTKHEDDCHSMHTPTRETSVTKQSQADIKQSPTVMKQSQTDMKQSQTVMKQSQTVMKQSQTVMKQSPTVMKQSQTDMKQSQTVMKQSQTVMKQPQPSLKDMEVESCSSPCQVNPKSPVQCSMGRNHGMDDHVQELPCNDGDNWMEEQHTKRTSSRSCKGRLYREFVMEGMLESLQRPERPFNCKKSWRHSDGCSLSDGDDVGFEPSPDKPKRPSRRKVRKRTVSGSSSLPHTLEFDYGEIDVESRLASLPQYSPDQFKPQSRCHHLKKSTCLYKNATFVKKEDRSKHKVESQSICSSSKRVGVTGSRKRKAPKSSILHLTLSSRQASSKALPSVSCNLGQSVASNQTPPTCKPCTADSSQSAHIQTLHGSVSGVASQALTSPLPTDSPPLPRTTSHTMTSSTLHRSVLTVS